MTSLSHRGTTPGEDELETAVRECLRSGRERFL